MAGTDLDIEPGQADRIADLLKCAADREHCEGTHKGDLARCGKTGRYCRHVSFRDTAVDESVREFFGKDRCLGGTGQVRVQDNDVLVLFSELCKDLSVALSGCNLLYLRHNSSPILSRSCIAALYSSALVDFPCQPALFSMKETPLPLTVFATMQTGLSFTSRASL